MTKPFFFLHEGARVSVLTFRVNLEWIAELMFIVVLVDEGYSLCVRVSPGSQRQRQWSLVKEDGVGFSPDWGRQEVDEGEPWVLVYVAKATSYLVGIMEEDDDYVLDADAVPLTEESVHRLEVGLIGVNDEVCEYGGVDADLRLEAVFLRRCFSDVFEKCGVYDEKGMPTRCFCYCQSCAGDWWTGVTNSFYDDDEAEVTLLGSWRITYCNCARFAPETGQMWMPGWSCGGVIERMLEYYH